MSVTFSVYPLPPEAHLSREIRFWCSSDPVVVESYRAEVEAAAHALSCQECALYDGPLVDRVLPFDELNMANGNAAELLTLVGFAGDDLYAGSCDAGELLGRLLVAGALLDPSPEVPERVERSSGGATLVDFGRPEGYLNDKVDRLAEVARFASDIGSSVVWS